MAEFRLLNEFGREPVVFALEPARRCVAHCTYCFATLNARLQSEGKARRHDDPGTFESIVERAFGPRYDPTNFAEWGLRNRLPVGFSNTVEPFQDVPQARGILGIAAALDLPLFLQSKGVNFDAVRDDLAPLAGNAVLFASFPTPDDAVLKRFEPGTPDAAARWAMIEAAAGMGLTVILALAPYHPSWNPDPGGFVREAAARGISAVFFDPLHLNRRQVAAAADRAMVDLAKDGWDKAAVEHAGAIYDAAAASGIEFIATNGLAPVWGVPSTVPGYVWEGCVERGRLFPYVDQAFLLPLLDAFGPEPGPPIAVEWGDALALMEAAADPDLDLAQPFRWGPLRGDPGMVLSKLAPAWQERLKPAAPMREVFRALWNTPRYKGFAWRHPFVRLAMRPDGTPWRSESGDVVMAFDPDWGSKKLKRSMASLDHCRRLDFSEVADAQR